MIDQIEYAACSLKITEGRAEGSSRLINTIVLTNNAAQGLGYLHFWLDWDVGPTLALFNYPISEAMRPGSGRELRVLLQATCLLEKLVDNCTQMF